MEENVLMKNTRKMPYARFSIEPKRQRIAGYNPAIFISRRMLLFTVMVDQLIYQYISILIILIIFAYMRVIV